MRLANVEVARTAPVVRATVPLDPPLTWSGVACPLVLVDEQGTELETQWEAVTFAPELLGDRLQVRVAEVIGRLPEGSTATKFSVEFRDRALRDKLAMPTGLARALCTNGALSLVIDGRPEAFRISDKRFRNGSVAVTLKLESPRAFGWLTVFDGLDVALLDLVVHNALPDASEFYFDSLSLQSSLPPLHFLSAWHEPDVGYDVGGTVALVRPRVDGKLHALEQRGVRIFQGALHDASPSAVALARELVTGAGWGVADSWTRIDAYQPHAQRVPDLRYRKAELFAACSQNWIAISGALVAGTPYGMGVATGGRLDWRHPWGHQYGGVTGGGNRFQWSGVDVLASGAPAGLLELRARLRMILDRQPVAIVQPDGPPEVVEHWENGDGTPRAGWRMSAADATFHSDGAFGWSKAPHALPAGREVCAEHTALMAYSPIDWQHHDRATKPAESLAWLSNDPIARWWVEMAAELWRMSQFTDKRLENLAAATAARGGVGLQVGRADGHGWENAAAANALKGWLWRATWQPWFERFAVAMVTAQMPNGLFQFLPVHNKNNQAAPFGDGKRAFWVTAKGTEEALLAGALVAVSRSVRLPDDVARAATEAVDRWSIYGVWFFLGNGAAAPAGFTDYVAVRPVTWMGNNAILGDPISDPAAAMRKNVDSSELLSPVGCAMLERVRNGRPVAHEQRLVASAVCNGAGDPLAWMKTQTLYKLQLDDCAPAHAALQQTP